MYLQKFPSHILITLIIQSIYRKVNKPMIYLLIANEADLQNHKKGIAKRAQPCSLYCSSFLNFQTFLRKPLELEIPEKTSFHPWKFCKLVWHLLEIPREYPCRAYSRPYGLDLYCIWLLNAAPFCKNYAKLYSNTKH